MTIGYTVLDPTNEFAPAQIPAATRPESLAGLTVGLLDISKPRGAQFLDRVELALNDLGANTIRYAKPTFSKPAPTDLRQQISQECDAVIEALAD